jgi:hypothetical protein
MERITEYLRRLFEVESLAAQSLTARLTVPEELQGPPAIAHGGAVAALLLELAERHARETGVAAALPRPLRAEVALARAVPLGTSLLGAAALDDNAVYRARITRRDGAVLAEAEILSPAGGLDDVAAPPPVEARDPSAPREEVPGAAMCLACGSRNPRGLGMRLDHDERRIWKHVSPPPQWLDEDDTAPPALAFVLLDEIGWWLGAMACGECGLSTRLSLTLGAPIALAAPLLVVGARDSAVSADTRGRQWRSRAFLLGESARPAATAEISFAGGQGFTRAMALDLFDPESRAAASRIFASMPPAPGAESEGPPAPERPSPEPRVSPRAR